MPESATSRVVEELSERSKHGVRPRSRTEEVIEIIEAMVLAFVAVATAWSGYQASQWDGYRVQLYAESNRLRVGACITWTRTQRRCKQSCATPM